jgi:hypothetical protein
MTPRTPQTDPLLDELSEEWQSVERAIWPNGPAHGTGSGVYAALKARIIARLREDEARALPDPTEPPDRTREFVRWFLSKPVALRDEWARENGYVRSGALPEKPPAIDVLAEAIDAAWRRDGADHHVFGPGLADQGRSLARLIVAEWPDA